MTRSQSPASPSPDLPAPATNDRSPTAFRAFIDRTLDRDRHKAVRHAATLPGIWMAQADLDGEDPQQATVAAQRPVYLLRVEPRAALPDDAFPLASPTTSSDDPDRETRPAP